jgi:signal transduction histidine kinase
LHGLKLREANIIQIVRESVARLSQHDNIEINIKSFLEDETVWIDQEQIVSVFYELVKNAVESMPDGGALIIMLEGDEREVLITLADKGSGIAEENMPLLFTPFFTTKAIGEGTGLALPLAYAAIKAHSGSISIESKTDPNKGPTGTTVKVFLPRRQSFQENQGKLILHEEEGE